MNNLMKKYSAVLGLGLMAYRDIYDTGCNYSRPPRQRQLTDKEKDRLHANEASKFHEYAINGEVVIARSKVDARRIYNKRHGIKKNK